MQLKTYTYEGILSNWKGERRIEYLQEKEGVRREYLQEEVRKNKKARRSEKKLSRRKGEEEKTIFNYCH